MKLCEVLVDDVERIQLFFNALHWIGVGAVSIGVLGFGLSIRGRGEVLTPTRIAALSVIPALSVIAWLGDPRVVDLFMTYAPVPGDIIWALEAVEATWPWFRWVSLVYLWGLVAIGSVFILETALDRPKLDPSRLFLGIMVAVPWTVSFLYEFGVIQWAEFDITVFGFVVTGVAGIATIDRFRLFDVPFARSQLVEEFSTPVLVYGRDCRLYDYNKQAATVLDISPRDLDEDIREVLADTALPISDQSVEHDSDLADELDGTQASLPAEDRDARYFQIQVSTLDTGATSALGYTIQLTDITDQHRQHEQTRRERDLKELIRSILVQLSSRDEIEQAFCDQLVTGDRYSFVWIGEYSMGDGLAVKTHAGERAFASGFDQYEPTKTIKERGLEALETGDVTVIHEAVSPDTDTVRDALMDTGIEGAAVIPFTHREVSYGILAVYTSRPDAFDSAERQLLADLGESVGFAINAVEQREALQGEQVREVRLGIADPDHYLVSLANTSHLKDTEATIDVYEIRDESISGSSSETAAET
jgi:GAF domain-containing protein